MRIHPLIKWGLLGGGLVLALLAVSFIVLLIYVVHTQRAYSAMPDTHDVKEQISQMGTGYVASHKNAALVIAIYQRGNEYVQGFGKISDANTNPPNERTIFEIGSVTKIFTATVLSEMVDSGEMKLDDPISLYLPKGVTSPTLEGVMRSRWKIWRHTLRGCHGCRIICWRLLKTSKIRMRITRRKISTIVWRWSS